MPDLKSEREINMIRGKMSANVATVEEIGEFLRYVTEIERLVEEASSEDFYGTDGWRHRFGWDEGC